MNDETPYRTDEESQYIASCAIKNKRLIERLENTNQADVGEFAEIETICIRAFIIDGMDKLAARDEIRKRLHENAALKVQLASVKPVVEAAKNISKWLSCWDCGEWKQQEVEEAKHALFTALDELALKEPKPYQPN